jgi:1,4-alpha-glucan branching enzyme
MVRIRPIPSADALEVTFVLDAPEAERAAVAIDSLGWSRVPMRRYPPGTGPLRLTIRLPHAPEVQFRYLVDDTTWRNDTEADTRPNAFGEENSVVTVGA